MKIYKILNLISKFQRIFFKIINDVKFKILIKNKKIISRVKIKKTKKIYINSFAFFTNESIYINELITWVTFFHNIYIIIYLIIYIDVENYYVKIIFDNKIKINYIFKKFVNKV